MGCRLRRYIYNGKGLENLDLLNFISINLYSIVILFCIFIYVRKQPEKELIEYKIFMHLIGTTIIVLVFDILGRFDGRAGTIYSTLNYWGNLVIYLFGTVIPSLWIAYVYYQIHHEMIKNKIIYLIVVVNVINITLTVLSQFFGWYYYIDASNIYHRGNFHFLFVTLIGILMAAASTIVVKNRDQIEDRKYFSLLFFPVPPTVCIILQVFFYGLALNLAGVSVSLLIVFINIQNHSMNIDYLTGAYNRKKLDLYMQEKISNCNENKSFAAILIDMDNFKYINDTFGHIAGDNALETSVKILKGCLRKTDFVARFGGDEFCIVLELENKRDLEIIISKINKSMNLYNKNSNKQYKLSFSMGYAIYDLNAHMSVEEFQRYIDELMYEKKRNKKELVRLKSFM